MVDVSLFYGHFSSDPAAVIVAEGLPGHAVDRFVDAINYRFSACTLLIDGYLYVFEFRSNAMTVPACLEGHST
jgi:hypothetical protein